MPTFVTLPGIGGSDDAHWQSLWERTDARFKRFQPSSWDHPQLSNWISALDEALLTTTESPVLVAHSLSCLLVAHWACHSTAAVAGAFLVSVPDPTGKRFPKDALVFDDVPTTPLPFPTLIVASTNDPYGTLPYVRSRAATWRAGLVEVGALGHINSDSGLGEWTEGRQLLEAFCAGLRKRPETNGR